MINLLIPMAGAGSRFQAAGFKKPKPFISILGKPMIEHVIRNLKTNEMNLVLLAREEHYKQEKETVDYLKENYEAKFVLINKLTEGTACTLLYARELIDDSNPLIIANSDQYVQFNIQNMLLDCNERNADGSILTFVDSERNPKWSFARLNSAGFVTQVKEKEPISEFATVGIYYFSQGKDFINGAIDMIIRNERVNNEFYTCPVYNHLISANKRIVAYTIEQSAMHGLGTPEDLEKFLSRDVLK